jgi:hypothetical protein
MGFLRKVGRKIKKGVKKLMGGKFGKILGGIGLAMTFMGGANALFGGNPLFEGIKETLGSMNPFKSNSVTEASSKAIEATSEIASSEGLREGATNYSSKFLTDTKYSDLATVGQKVKKTFIEGKEFLLPEDSTFVGDVTRSVGSTLLLQGVQGEEEQQIRTGQPLQAASYQSPQTTQPLSPMLASTQPLPQQFQTTLTYGTV